MKNLILLSIIALLFSNCKKAEPCSGNIVCTEELRQILVEIEYVSSYPYIDEVKTYKKKNNKLVYHLENIPITQSKLPVLSDIEKDETSTNGDVFIFEAYNNGGKVFSEEYVIKHDCCHIIKVSGKDTINL